MFAICSVKLPSGALVGSSLLLQETISCEIITENKSVFLIMIKGLS